MKKILFSAVTALTLLSCSQNDNNSGSTLSKEIVTGYYQGEITNKTVADFSDGKLVKVSDYDPSGELIYYYTNTFNADDLLEYSFIYDDGNNQIGVSKYYYDNLGRIIKSEFDDNGTFYNREITYNEDGTATNIQSNGAVTTYYINEDNLVYKEVQGNYTTEVVYDGFNPVSIIINGLENTFSYYDTPSYSNIKKNLFGSYRANNVLADGPLDACAQDYITKYPYKISQYGEENVRHEYVFNGNGLPVKRSSYYYGELEVITEYIYQ